MRRLDSLTGLRFFAALAVFAWHLQPALHGAGLRLVRPGPLGVSFFFVLSGFVLAWSQRPDLPRETFWRNRFARVYPNHLVAVAVTVLLLVAQGAPIGGRALALQVPLLQAWVPDQSVYFGVLSVDWSLSCEALFYASFPLLLPLVQRHGWWLVGPLLGAAVVVDLAALLSRPDVPAAAMVHLDYWAYIFPVTRLAEFALGVLAAVLVQRGVQRVPVAAAAGAVGVVLVVVTQLPTPVDVAALAAPLFALLIVAVAQQELDGSRSWLTRRWAVVLGEWSFAFYLVHTIVLRALLPKTHSLPVLVLAGLLLSVAGAAALHHVVERPMERRLRARRDRLSVSS